MPHVLKFKNWDRDQAKWLRNFQENVSIKLTRAIYFSCHTEQTHRLELPEIRELMENDEL